jgi:plastocyanin
MYTHMKLLMGFIVLLVTLVAVTGCTQTTSPSAQTTATTVPTTEVTTAAVPVATTAATTAPVTTETVVANVTAAPAANATTAAPTTAVILTPTPATMVTTIYFTRAGFIPQTDIIMPGTGVSFVNNDNATHVLLTTGNNTGMFNSGIILPKAAFPYTFSATGTYTYALQDNTSATGTIIVQTPSGVTSYGQAS